MRFLRDETASEYSTGTETAQSQAGNGGKTPVYFMDVLSCSNAQSDQDYNTSLSYLPDDTKLLCVCNNQPLKSRHIAAEEFG